MIPKSVIKMWLLRDLFGPDYEPCVKVDAAFSRLSDESLAAAYCLRVIRPGWFA